MSWREGRTYDFYTLFFGELITPELIIIGKLIL